MKYLNASLLFFAASLFFFMACTPKLTETISEESPQPIIEEDTRETEDLADAPELEILKGLRATTGKELSENGEPVIMDPETIPMYSPEGIKLTPEEMASFLTSGEYVPVPYVDDNMELKLFLLKEATPDQKRKMAEMMRRMDNPSQFVGQEAKTFETIDMEDQMVSLDQYEGKVVVLNFWFINCKPCIMEMPDLNKLVNDYKDKDVVFLAFSPDSKVALEKFRKRKAFDYQVIASSNDVINAYQIQGFPTHVVIDKKGLIQHYETGLSQNTIYDLRDKIDLLLE